MNPKPNDGRGWPWYGDTPKHSATSASCSSSGKEGATSFRLAIETPQSPCAHGREGATDMQAVPWIQRAANWLEPETGDAVVFALACAVLAAVAGVMVYGWLA